MARIARFRVRRWDDDNRDDVTRDILPDPQNFGNAAAGVLARLVQQLRAADAADAAHAADAAGAEAGVVVAGGVRVAGDREPAGRVRERRLVRNMVRNQKLISNCELEEI